MKRFRGVALAVVLVLVTASCSRSGSPVSGDDGVQLDGVVFVGLRRGRHRGRATAGSAT